MRERVWGWSWVGEKEEFGMEIRCWIRMGLCDETGWGRGNDLEREMGWRGRSVGERDTLGLRSVGEAEGLGKETGWKGRRV